MGGKKKAIVLALVFCLLEFSALLYVCIQRIEFRVLRAVIGQVAFCRIPYAEELHSGILLI